MSNPFSISFGKKPTEYISRVSYTDKIINTFNSESPSSQAYMITGIRGAGKTVILSSISKELKSKKTWIVFELNTTRNLLNAFAANLYSLPMMHERFLEAKIDLSLLGIGVSIENSNKFSDIEQAISAMLEIVAKKKMRILITVDEVTNNQYMREFASAFQIYIRNDYPIFLIMTGLYKNVNSLQNYKTLTFLYRTPKIKLENLNIIAIAQSYKNIFSISEENAKVLSALTNGYPFAFQALGYSIYNNKQVINDENFSIVLQESLIEYDQILQEYAYEKIWSELSQKEKEIMIIMADNIGINVKEIRKIMDVSSVYFGTYNRRLKNKGVVNSEGYGQIKFTLPRFDKYIKYLQEDSNQFEAD